MVDPTEIQVLPSWNRVMPLRLNALALGSALLFFCSLAWWGNPFVFILASIGAVVLGCYLGGYSPRWALGLAQGNFQSIVLAPLLTYLIILPGVFVTSLMSEAICRKWGLTWEPQAILKDFLTLKNKGEILQFILLAVFIAPFTEEILFRGFLYAWLKSIWPKWIALFFTAALFALLHQHLPVFLPLMWLGIVLALLYEKTGSLWSNIVLHALFNGITLLVALYYPELVTR